MRRHTLCRYSRIAGSAAPRTVTVNQRGKEFTPAAPPAAPQDGDPWKIASWLGLGWNMGNHFDGFYNGSSAGEKEGYPDETVWHQQGKATQSTFIGVKAAGFTKAAQQKIEAAGGKAEVI